MVKRVILLHNEQGLFKTLKQPLTVTRYHSLVVDKDTLPEELEVSAWLVMVKKWKLWLYGNIAITHCECAVSPRISTYRARTPITAKFY